MKKTVSSTNDTGLKINVPPVWPPFEPKPRKLKK